jgi:hypothetical protein
MISEKIKIKIINLLISSFFGVIWIFWLLLSFNLRPVWNIGEIVILGQFEYIYLISLFFIYVFLYSPEYCQNSWRSIKFLSIIAGLVFVDVLFLFAIEIITRNIQFDYYYWLSIIRSSIWLLSLKMIFLCANGIIVGFFVYHTMSKWRKFQEMVDKFSSVHLFNKKRFLRAGIIFLISSLVFTGIYLNSYFSSILLENYYLLGGIVFLIQTILYKMNTSRHRSSVDQILDIFLLALIDILGISFFNIKYLEIFTSDIQNGVEMIGFWILLLAYLLSLVRFLSRTNLSDKFEEILQKSETISLPNAVEKNEIASSEIHSIKEKNGTYDLNEICCPKCQKSFNYSEDILNVFEQRTLIFCPHCGNKIWWYDLTRDSNQRIFLQHQHVINELRKLSDEEGLVKKQLKHKNNLPKDISAFNSEK